MIITVATMKGGSGKSTLASCLAVHWHLRGRRPTLIDADPQRSIVRLAARERALGGVAVIEDATEDASKTARRLAGGGGLVIIDTPGFRSQDDARLHRGGRLSARPRKAVAVRRRSHAGYARHSDRPCRGRRPLFRCVLTQTTRDSVIAKHIRAELAEAGLPVLNNEMSNRVAYPEAALWGATPSLISWKGPGGEGDRHHRRRGRHGARRATGRSMTRKPLPKAIRRPSAICATSPPSTPTRKRRRPSGRRRSIRAPPSRRLRSLRHRSPTISRAIADRRGSGRRGATACAAHKIVSRYKNFAALGGLVPLPVVNIASVAAINLRMVKQLVRSLSGAVPARPHAGADRRPDRRRGADRRRNRDIVDTDVDRAGRPVGGASAPRRLPPARSPAPSAWFSSRASRRGGEGRRRIRLPLACSTK